MTEQKKQRYVSANDLRRIESDQVWYNAELNIIGIQNFECGSIQQLDVEEPQVTMAGIFTVRMWVHDFSLLGWIKIGDM